MTAEQAAAAGVTLRTALGAEVKTRAWMPCPSCRSGYLTDTGRIVGQQIVKDWQAEVVKRREAIASVGYGVWRQTIHQKYLWTLKNLGMKLGKPMPTPKLEVPDPFANAEESE